MFCWDKVNPSRLCLNNQQFQIGAVIISVILNLTVSTEDGVKDSVNDPERLTLFLLKS